MKWEVTKFLHDDEVVKLCQMVWASEFVRAMAASVDEEAAYSAACKVADACERQLASSSSLRMYGEAPGRKCGSGPWR